MAAPLVMSFNLDAFSQGALEEICRAMDIRVKAVPSGDHSKAMGALAGLPFYGVAPDEGEPDFSAPMLVMCWMEEAVFDRFLSALRDVPMLRTPLKAVLTPFNVAWHARRLYAELAREHALMRSRRTEQE